MENSVMRLRENFWLQVGLNFLVVCFFVVSPATAQTGQKLAAHFVVSYLGIPILDVYQDVHRDDSLVTVNYDNQIKPFWATFRNVNNRYSAVFTAGTFRPVLDEKEIQEGDFDQNLTTRYQDEKGIITYSNGQMVTLKKGLQSVFSAVHYLEASSRRMTFPRRLEIVIEGEIWYADVRDLGLESVVVLDQLENTQHLLATMHPDGGHSIVKRTDILMDFLTTTDSTLELWIDDEQRIVRAQVGEFPKAVVLELVKNGVNNTDTD